MATQTHVNLYGRVFLRGSIQAATGLHIGGSPATMAIGGVDNPVIRDAVTNQPYVPGSSLRGKMRSLWEKSTGVPQNWPIGKGVKIHICEKAEDYHGCPVCQIYGVPGQLEASYPTRLFVRDMFLSEESARQLREDLRTDLPYTEVKWEAAIDRVTSAATPRQIERVPAGAVFEGMEMVFSVYDASDLDRFIHVIEAMQLLEDDYLGGLGSRGSGKIRFESVRLSLRATRSSDGYGEEIHWPDGGDKDQGFSVGELLKRRAEIIAWLKDNLPLVPYNAG
ncbi:MAG: type III-A CRISPR-associated RAMP protein Csm3 [Anaerolineae bacterium]